MNDGTAAEERAPLLQILSETYKFEWKRNTSSSFTSHAFQWPV